MKEYKVLTVRVREAEFAINDLAREGWRVVAVTPNVAKGYGIVVTLERERSAI